MLYNGIDNQSMAPTRHPGVIINFEAKDRSYTYSAMLLHETINNIKRRQFIKRNRRLNRISIAACGLRDDARKTPLSILVFT
jgi:hypothetical protein